MSGVLVAAVLTPHRRFLLRHTFSGAALTPSDQGANLRDTGTLAVVSGGVLTKTTASNCLIVAAIGAPNLVVQWKTNFGNSAGTDRRSQIRVRHTYGVSRYNFMLYRSSNVVKIQRFDSGTTTTDLASVAYAMADSTNYWVRAIAAGPRLELLVSTDGTTFTSMAAVTDTTYAAGAGEDFEIDLVDNVASPTILVDDLLVWTP